MVTFYSFWYVYQWVTHLIPSHDVSHVPKDLPLVSPHGPPRLLGQARSRGVGMVRNERLPDDVDVVFFGCRKRGLRWSDGIYYIILYLMEYIHINSMGYV